MAENKKRKTTPLPDDPAERFKVVANRRVNVAIGAIQSIGSVTGPTYKYTDVQGTAVLEALQTAVDNLKTRLNSRSKVKEGGFSL